MQPRFQHTNLLKTKNSHPSMIRGGPNSIYKRRRVNFLSQMTEPPPGHTNVKREAQVQRLAEINAPIPKRSSINAAAVAMRSAFLPFADTRVSVADFNFSVIKKLHGAFTSQKGISPDHSFEGRGFPNLRIIQLKDKGHESQQYRKWKILRRKPILGASQKQRQFLYCMPSLQL